MRRLLPLVLALAGCAPAAALAPPASPPPPPPAAPPPVAAPAATTPDAPKERAPQLGSLDFAVTGSPECQRAFVQGMLALHSFEYDQAHETFAGALAAGDCPMAAWGDAMTYEHPVWRERDVAKARAALAKITGEEKLTPKERAYVATARALFADDDGKKAHEAWLAAAAKMHDDFPGDDEVALQHALALLAVYGYDPTHVRQQMEAGAIALDVLARHPDHPGAAHYAIHAFDSPEHAILALNAARTYARIAPAAGHALHMPSHTFTHLGMWREVVPSNERAYAASVAWAKAHKESPSDYDWHSYSWLVAANLELGHAARARQLVDDARAMLDQVERAKDDDSATLRFGYVNMVYDYVAQTGRWSEAEGLVAPVFAPAIDEHAENGKSTVACAAHAPGGGKGTRPPFVLLARAEATQMLVEAALRAGDAAAAEKRLGETKAIATQMAPWEKTLTAQQKAENAARAQAFAARVRALAAKTPAARAAALDAIARYVAADDAAGISGPAFWPTPRETLGDALLASGKAIDAQRAYEKEAALRPGRAMALLGAARAAKAAGDATKARAHYATLAEQWKDADADFAPAAEVRGGT